MLLHVRGGRAGGRACEHPLLLRSIQIGTTQEQTAETREANKNRRETKQRETQYAKLIGSLRSLDTERDPRTHK